MSLNSLLFLTKIQILALIVLSCSKSTHTCLLGSLNSGSETDCRHSLLKNEKLNRSSRLLGLPLNLDSVLNPVVGGGAPTVENAFSKPVLITADQAVNGVVGAESEKIEKIKEFIKNAGYPFQRHEVETKDGYILNVFRIPYGKKNKGRKNRQPVYIGHGLCSSAADWIVQGEKESLPYILADQGYDVWLANSRGNIFARDHIHLHEADKQYWNFSVHEMGKYDVPATIDYILRNTTSKKLNYIGYSMSTTSYFICMSENATYNGKIDKTVLIAPAVYLTKTNVIGKLISEVPEIDEKLQWNLLSGGQLAPETIERLAHAMGHVCGVDTNFLPYLCTFVAGILAGGTTANVRQQVIHNTAEFFPTSASGKTLAHYLQFFRMKFFGQYDTRPYLLDHYVGDNIPQEYKLSATTGHIRFIYGESDELTTQQDIQKLIDDLKNVKTVSKNSIPEFNHLSFVYADKAAERVYKPIADYFNSKS